MQSNKRFDTFLPREGHWIMANSSTGNTYYSDLIENFLIDIGMELEDLNTVLRNTKEGKWPALLGGKTYKLSMIIISREVKIFTLLPIESRELSTLMTAITGEKLFILISPRGKIMAMSAKAISLFENHDNIVSIFDASSSGVIESAINDCLVKGTARDFLVTHSTPNNRRSNYSMSMRKLASPGRLIFCRLMVPSIAVVGRAIDSKTLISSLLEDDFSPAILVDSKGVIYSMNKIARNICLQMWGTNPTGSSVFELVHPDYRKAVELRYKQESRSYTTASRLALLLQPSKVGSEFKLDISTISIPDSNMHIIFGQAEVSSPGNYQKDINGSIQPALMKLLIEDDISQSEILETTIKSLGATSAAFVHEGEVLTVGDSRELMKSLDPIQLAASRCGFREDGIFLHRIHSGFSISHLVIQGLREKTLEPAAMAVLYAASKVLSEREAKSSFRSGHRMLTTIKTLAESFLKRSEPLDGLLSDLAKECRAETAVVFKINQTGTALKGIGASGVVGMLLELQINALNTASWACIHGETAFYAETAEENLRFSPVFPNSRSELAVPYFNGSTPDGVILLASTETEAFHYTETEMIQTMAILFTTPENANVVNSDRTISRRTDPLNQNVLEYIIHNITALNSASKIHFMSLEKRLASHGGTTMNTESLADSVIRLGLFSKWTLWWLKISIYGGTPDQRWINPIPLLEKVLNEFKSINELKKFEYAFHPPAEEIEVCTDGAFISMIAYSLLMCIVDYCDNCRGVDLTVEKKKDHWSFRLDTTAGSIPGECLTVDRQPEKQNMAFILAWRLAEELGGTVSTFSNKGKTTRMVVRLKVNG